MFRTVRFTAVVLTGLTLTACQSNIETPLSVAPSNTTPTSSSTSLNNNGLMSTRTAQTALEGRNYTTLYTVDPRGKSGASVAVIAIGVDGTAVIVNNWPTPPSSLLIGQAQVGIQIGQSRKWFPIQTGSPPRGVSDAAIHGQSVVWVEATQAMRPSTDLKVFAVHVGQPHPNLLSDAQDLAKSDVIPVSLGGKFITTDGVHAWWLRTYPMKGPRGWGARIMVRDLAAHEPIATAVDGAKNPAATAEGLLYVRSNDVDSKMSANRYEIRLRQAKADTLITSGQLFMREQVSTMCASDTLLAWAVRSPNPPASNPEDQMGGQLHVMVLATKVQKIIQLDDPAWGLDLSCGNTFVAWGNGSGNGDPGQYVFDVSSNKIWKLGEHPGLSAVLATGSMLAWALPLESSKAAPWRITKWDRK
ncbi:hypothetical protein GALL_352680 [mine drainage metagenome]|uniref:Lipoprotein n=1 Tax=mine drainage metagenome TaxID=410659 RepID=A0A1J5QHD1_9ZZZZ